MRYTCDFVTADFDDFPEVSMNDTIVNKFQDVHDITVDDSMVVPEEMVLRGNSVSLTVEIP